MPWQPDYITVAQLKGWVRVDDGVDDIELATIATTISREIDKTCNRQFGQVSAPELRYYTPMWNRRRCLWVVPIDDLMTSVGLIVGTAAGTITEFDLEPRNAAAKGKPWTHIAIRKTNTVTIKGEDYEFANTGKWGWSAVPVPVLQAAKLQGHRLLSRRGSPFGIAGSPQQGSELRLLERLDPDVAVALRSDGMIRPRRVG